MAEIRIAKELCIGCEQCVAACPFGQISLVDGVAVIASDCSLCGSCVAACGTEAIQLDRGPVSVSSAIRHTGIWVFAEQADGEVKSVSYELLGAARRLAEQRPQTVSAVLLGSSLGTAAEQLIAHGADQVFVVESQRLSVYNDELYAEVFSRLVAEHHPEIVLIGATSYGRSLAPRVASRLDTGLTADCTELSIDQETGLLLQTRPAFGGNLMATITCPHHRPQMASVRPRVMKALPPDEQRQGQVLAVEPNLPTTVHTRVLEVCESLDASASLTEAEIVVAVGKGVGSAANIAVVTELVKHLGAALGATRAVVDAGWVNYSQQIGQTGKTVSPKLYIACGISGAVQHLAGMSSAETIVAINKDPEASIFAVAHYGIVGDVMEVLPALIEQLRERRSMTI